MPTALPMPAYTLSSAEATRQPPPGLIHHTDRGSQYTSAAYQEALDSADAVASMSRKGNCWDNAVSESFFGTLEQELVGQSEMPADADAARTAVSSYIHGFYNGTRRHSTLGYQSPVDFENVPTVLDEGRRPSPQGRWPPAPGRRRRSRPAWAGDDGEEQVDGG